MFSLCFSAISCVKVRLISAANREARGMMGLQGIAGVRLPRVPQGLILNAMELELINYSDMTLRERIRYRLFVWRMNRRTARYNRKHV